MCPRCLSRKKNITQVASTRDMRNRLKLARVDSAARRYDIELVRKMLFEKGLAITSVFIERVLDATSGVPTRVCVPLYLPVITLIFLAQKIRTPFLNFRIACTDSSSIFMKWLSPISCMNSSWASGKLSSYI